MGAEADRPGDTREYVVELADVDSDAIARFGGKAVNLSRLRRIGGDVRVPPGFVIATPAFALASTSMADVRAVLAERVERALSRMSGDLATPVAVRSSATAEDLATASFAGQYDSFLNVVGIDSVLARVADCWASLLGDRAVKYGDNAGVDGASIGMAVIVQKMVAPLSSGVMFTADPLTGDRRVVAIEAGFGLGDALVSGVVTPATFRVCRGEVVDRTPPGDTTCAAQGSDGGVDAPLTDAQVLRLAQLGRQIEANFGAPQDIEWCFDGEDFWFVQVRPITSLYPVPEPVDDAKHVYVSVGHGQMMTDAMKPLGLSFWQMTTPAPMSEAGSRLFVDVTARLKDPLQRDGLLDVFGKSDPLLRDALEQILESGELDDPDEPANATSQSGAAPSAAPPPIEMLDADPNLVEDLIRRTQESIASCSEQIQGLSGLELLEFIQADIGELRRILFDPESHRVFNTAMDASWWLNEHILEWLGEPNFADSVSQSLDNNVTSEMGLALLDVADTVREHAGVVAHLSDNPGPDLLTALDGIEGGPECRNALEDFLDRYGMRCAGEIDITRPRWAEKPTELVPLVLAHVSQMEPGEAERRFSAGQDEASSKTRDALRRLAALPGGEAKAAETAKMIDRVRTFMGYREYPKYGMVSRYFIYRTALLGEADRMVERGVLNERDDIYYLRFDELRNVIESGAVDPTLVSTRREDFARSERLNPPRVLTSDGEALTGSYRRKNLPGDALAGLGVSTGIVEGRARLISDINGAVLEPGDIVVTAYTDPSWTPLFVSIAGLVTEVGGVMTHGAVIAREYGLPAVVAVPGATSLIREGQRLRVDGTRGVVEIL